MMLKRQSAKLTRQRARGARRPLLTSQGRLLALKVK
jgi:hypothetical protein